MATRRQSREWAVQLLFQWDMNRPDDVSAFLKQFWSETPADHRARAFTERLVRGVLQHLPEMDVLLEKLLENWELQRVGAIERNAIRLALYEMHHCDDIPPVVSINEAVDIAKFFSSPESGRFVNGVLDRARSGLTRDSRCASGPSARPSAGVAG